DNKGGCAADRPELFQEPDSVQEREVVAGDRCPGDCTGVDRLALSRARRSRVLERAAEFSAYGAGEAMCGLPCAAGGGGFRQALRIQLVSLVTTVHRIIRRRRPATRRSFPVRRATPNIAVESNLPQPVHKIARLATGILPHQECGRISQRTFVA